MDSDILFPLLDGVTVRVGLVQLLGDFVEMLVDHVYFTLNLLAELFVSAHEPL